MKSTISLLVLRHSLEFVLVCAFRMRANTAASAAVLVFASFATATARSTVSRHPGHTNQVSSTNVTASPLPKFYNGTCTPETVTIRREWSSLSNEEKAAYIQAQQCAMSLPAQTTMKNVVCDVKTHLYNL